MAGAAFGQASDLPILITNVGCSGTENSILDCSYDLNPSCGHHQDAGVVCPEPCYLLGDIRLINGSSASQGRVEVCIGGVWSSVCADESVCEDVGKLACAYLGFSSLRKHRRTSYSFHQEKDAFTICMFGYVCLGADVFGLAIYGESPGPVGIEDISCPPGVTNFTQCSFTSPSTCSHSMDAGLNCYPDSPCA